MASRERQRPEKAKELRSPTLPARQKVIASYVTRIDPFTYLPYEKKSLLILARLDHLDYDHASLYFLKLCPMADDCALLR